MNNAFIIIILSSMFLFSTSCKRDIQVTIRGQVDSINGTKVRITNSDFSIIYDSTIVKNNKFQFNSIIPEEGFYYIDFNSNKRFKEGNTMLPGWMHSCLIYLKNNQKYMFHANGKSEILNNYYLIHSSSYNQQKLSEFNSMVNNKRKALLNIKDKYLRKMDRSLAQGNKSEYNNYADSVVATDDEMIHVKAKCIRQFIQKNPNTLITPYLISEMPDFFERYSLYKKVMDGLDPDVKKTSYAKRAFVLLKSTEKLRIGGDVPEIYGSDTKGKPFSYDYSKKQYTLIDFWASWCLPCRYQTPALKKIYQKYKNKGFNIISISLDERKDWWTRISKLDEIPWDNVSELVKVKDSKNKANFVANRLPFNYLINSKGKIIGREIGLDSLDRFLKRAL